MPKGMPEGQDPPEFISPSLRDEKFKVVGTGTQFLYFRTPRGKLVLVGESHFIKVRKKGWMRVPLTGRLRSLRKTVLLKKLARKRTQRAAFRKPRSPNRRA